MLNKHLIVETNPIAREENVILWNDYRITLLTDRLIRIEKDVNRTFCDDATLAIWYRKAKRVAKRIAETDDCITVKTAKATLNLFKSFEKSNIKIGRKTVSINNDENLMGTYRTLDEYNGAYLVQRGEVKGRIPMGTGIMSKNGVAVYDDTETPILNKEGMPDTRREQAMDIYVFAYGTDYRAALKGLYAITGKTPLIPRYAFGNWWSRYHAYTDREYLHVLDRLASRNLPFTVATIDMDWHWSTTLDRAKKITESGKNDALHGGNNGWTGYSWNTELFPDHKDFLNKIKERNLKITLNLHPADGVRYFEDMYPEMATAMGVDPATEAKIPFDFTDTKFINAYFDILHKPHEHDGVEFWWIDWQQGNNTAIKNYDPLWGLNHFHYLDNAKEHTPLILSRYAGIGSHRYPLGFSGDTHITWDSLDFIPYFTAIASNAGYTWWSHDIGGHMFGSSDNELYARYVQFGVFSPINRLHCSSWPTMTKEPSAYMNGTGLIAEEFLRFRHKLIPYLYSASYETTENDRALIEPMYYEHSKDKQAYRAHNQYYFGSELLVAPVTTPADKNGLATTKVWLPAGHWTDIFTGDEYDGGRTVEMVRWLDNLPALLKEGGILVLDGRKHTNDVSNPDVFDVLIANGNGKYVLHEDNDCGKRAKTTFLSSASDNGHQTLEFKGEDPRGILPKRTYRLQFRNIKKGMITATANGAPIPFEWDDDGYLTVLLTNVLPGVTYRIDIEFTPKSPEQLRRERILYSMIRIVGNYNYKNKLYSELIKSPVEELPAVIAGCELPASAKKRLLEII